MLNVYGLAWKLLEKRIAKSRRQSISKIDLMQWRLEALEEAIDEYTSPTIVFTGVGESGKQETPQT